jgi:serine/threonine protein kinase
MYMSPERMQGGAYSFEADVWSLCLSLLTCSLGRFPFKLSSGYWGINHSINEEQFPPFPELFSSDLGDIIMKGLRRKSNERPSPVELLKSGYFIGMSEVGRGQEDGKPDLKSDAFSDWYQCDVVEKRDKVSLDKIVETVISYYRDLFISTHVASPDQSTNNEESIVSVKLDIVKLRALAEQLDLPPCEVVCVTDYALRKLEEELREE